MGKAAEERPEYIWLREFKETHGRDLLQKYGAHALGIGWKRIAGEKMDRLALIFYVERKEDLDELTFEPIPPSITFIPTNSERPVRLETDVIESPPAEFEWETAD